MADDPSQLAQEGAAASQMGDPSTEQASTDKTQTSEARLVERWITVCRDVPEHARVTREYQEILKILHPERWNDTDPYRGLIPKELRSRVDNARIETPLVARNAKMLLAMAVPEDHEARWEPRATIEPDGDPRPTTLVESRKRFGETLNLVQQAHLEDCNWQEVIEGWTFAGICSPISWLKVVYDPGKPAGHPDPIEQSATIDDETQGRRALQCLVEAYGAGEFDKDSPQYAKLLELHEALGDDSEGDLVLRSGIRAEVLAPDRVRFDPHIRCPEKLMSARWILHEADLTKEQVLAYKKQEIDTGNGEKTTIGITREEIDAYFDGEENAASGTGGAWRASFTSQATSSSATGTAKDPTLDPSQATARKTTIRVWEIWCREEQRVHVICPDLDLKRRLATWVPKRTPEQWYPFVPLVLVPLPGEATGVGLAWWGKDPQERINCKRSDQEKARYLSLPRYGYDASVGNVTEGRRLADTPPFEFFTANLQGRNWEDVVKEFSAKFDPTAFDASADRADLDGTMGINDATRGVLGEAKFATEVQASVQGLSSWATHLQTRLRRAVGAAYKLVAELLIQHMPPRMATEIAGPGAVWPLIYSDREADQIVRKIAFQVGLERARMQQGIQQAAATGALPPADPAMVQQMIDDRADDLQEQLTVQAFGLAEPVTRARLFRACRLRIDVALDAQIDRQARTASMKQVADVILTMSQAGMAMNRPFQPEPILRTLAGMFGIQGDVEDMYPPAPPTPLMPPMAPGGGAGPEAQGPAGDEQTLEQAPGGEVAPNRVLGSVGQVPPI